MKFLVRDRCFIRPSLPRCGPTFSAAVTVYYDQQPELNAERMNVCRVGRVMLMRASEAVVYA